MTASIDRLCKLLGYQFKDTGLVTLALTHRSVSNKNNERLEFLGDAVLGCVIADELFTRFPKATEGQLTRMRASLVKGETLAKIGRELELGDHLRLGSGELKSGGFRRASILACGVEALLGAIWQDGGFEAAQAAVRRLFASRLEAISPDEIQKDPKTRLQEYLQGRKLPLPVYELLRIEGEAHDQMFHVECRVEGLDVPVQGGGTTRRKAEQAAARQAYKALVK